MLTIVARDVRTLQIVDGYQRDYLNEVSRWKALPEEDRDSDEMAENEKTWFDTVSLLFWLLVLVMMARGRVKINN